MGGAADGADAVNPDDLPVLNWEESKKDKVMIQVNEGNFGPFLRDFTLGKVTFMDQTKSGLTALHEAIWQGNLEIVAQFIDELDYPLEIRSQDG